MYQQYEIPCPGNFHKSSEDYSTRINYKQKCQRSSLKSEAKSAEDIQLLNQADGTLAEVKQTCIQRSW